MSKRIDAGPPGDREARRLRSEPVREQDYARHDRMAYILGALLIVFGLFTSAVAYTMVRSHTYNPVIGIVNYFVPAPDSTFGKERIFVLLTGLDYDYNNLDEPTSKDSRAQRKDPGGGRYRHEDAAAR